MAVGGWVGGRVGERVGGWEGGWDVVGGLPRAPLLGADAQGTPWVGGQAGGRAGGCIGGWVGGWVCRTVRYSQLHAIPHNVHAARLMCWAGHPVGLGWAGLGWEAGALVLYAHALAPHTACAPCAILSSVHKGRAGRGRQASSLRGSDPGACGLQEHSTVGRPACCPLTVPAPPARAAPTRPDPPRPAPPRPRCRHAEQPDLPVGLRGPAREEGVQRAPQHGALHPGPKKFFRPRPARPGK